MVLSDTTSAAIRVAHLYSDGHSRSPFSRVIRKVVELRHFLPSVTSTMFVEANLLETSRVRMVKTTHPPFNIYLTKRKDVLDSTILNKMSKSLALSKIISYESMLSRQR